MHRRKTCYYSTIFSNRYNYINIKYVLLLFFYFFFTKNLYLIKTGNSYATLEYHFRRSKAIISSIVPETCEAIYSVLKDKYFKVRFLNSIYLFIYSLIHIHNLIYIILDSEY